MRRGLGDQLTMPRLAYSPPSLRSVCSPATQFSSPTGLVPTQSHTSHPYALTVVVREQSVSLTQQACTENLTGQPLNNYIYKMILIDGLCFSGILLSFLSKISKQNLFVINNQGILIELRIIVIIR